MYAAQSTGVRLARAFSKASIANSSTRFASGGTSTTIKMHDGSRLYLHKLADGYDTTDPDAAIDTIRKRAGSASRDVEHLLRHLP